MPNTKCIRTVKSFRAEYKDLEDRMEAFKNSLPRCGASRYISLAYTELESSRHWLGEALGAFGEESPYRD
jgi:hypothetical protein